MTSTDRLHASDGRRREAALWALTAVLVVVALALWAWLAVLPS